MDGEIGLLNAVLHAAVKDLTSKSQASKEAAIGWFEDERSHHIFSFEPLCVALGYDADTIRRKVGVKRG